MTIELPLSTAAHSAPSYMRRTPRWYDGVARLLDIGNVFDWAARPISDREKLLEDRAMVQLDMRHAVRELRATLDARGEKS